MNPVIELRNSVVRREVAREAGLRMTAHAIDRACEMRVPARALAEIVSEGSSWPQRSGVSGRTGQLHVHPDWPPWGVVTGLDEGQEDVVVTIVFRTGDRYVREGATFRTA